MTINQISKLIEFKYPKRTAESWDTVGLLFGSKKQRVNKVLVAVDVTKEVFDHAINNQYELIISHHPLTFESTLEEEYKKAPYKKDLIKRIESTGMGVYSLHTNFDNSKKGMATALANRLGFKSVSSIKDAKHGKMIQTSKSPKELKTLISNKLGLKTAITNATEGAVYTQVAILPGSGAVEDIIAAKDAGAGLIITSDVKWSTWVTAKEMGISILEISHIAEDVFPYFITAFLNRKTKDLKVDSIHTKEIAEVI